MNWRGGGSEFTARPTCSKWSRHKQLADSRTITRRDRVIASAATLINRLRQVQAKPSPSGSRRRRRLKNFLRAGSSSAAVGSSGGRPSSAAVGAVLTTARRSHAGRFSAAAWRWSRKKFCHEPVVAEQAGVQFDLRLLVPILAHAAHRVFVVDRGGRSLQPGRLVTTARRLSRWAFASTLTTTGRGPDQILA